MDATKNPWILNQRKRANITASHKRAPKQEKRIAAIVQGSRTPASGSRDVKGDVRKRGIVRIEAKTTKHRSFSVTLEMIEKIEEAAVSTGEMPVLVVEFNDGKGKLLKEVAIVPTYVLADLYDQFTTSPTNPQPGGGSSPAVVSKRPDATTRRSPAVGKPRR